MRALSEQGVTVLTGLFRPDLLSRLKDAAGTFDFPAISYAVPLNALEAAEICSTAELLALIDTDGLADHLSAGLPGPVQCDLQHSWMRKRFAPKNAPRLYQPNTWHQDGGLGASFTPDPRSVPEMNRLLTCWIPLQDCGRNSPGLEIVRQRLDGLLHYTELDDVRLRQRFAPDRFWAPELELGDGLLLLPGTLHRTHVRPEMEQDRLSLEYRFFPV
jgi:hypothetical protein